MRSGGGEFAPPHHHTHSFGADSSARDVREQLSRIEPPGRVLGDEQDLPDHRRRVLELLEPLGGGDPQAGCREGALHLVRRPQVLRCLRGNAVDAGVGLSQRLRRGVAPEPEHETITLRPAASGTTVFIFELWPFRVDWQWFALAPEDCRRMRKFLKGFLVRREEGGCGVHRTGRAGAGDLKRAGQVPSGIGAIR